MDKYNPSEIEAKWQEFWAKNPDLYSVKNGSKEEKKYILDMFPYPSGDGLHAGHVESYSATDIIARHSRMKGFNVLHPQGFDAFGLPAENYAIKTKIHPLETTKKAIATFTAQMKMMGFSYDWDRTVVTTEKEYYKWTQWFFLMLYKNGLAYKKKAKVNWCENCQTVLANEQAEGGICDRCKNPVIQKDLEQWFFKITDFIENKNETAGLIDGLEKVDWPASTKLAQINWIGKSEGTQFKMQIEKTNKFIEVYTTRIDTVFGVTYAVVAPENKIVSEIKEQIENWEEVEKYISQSKKKTDLDRMEAKEKTGVELKGIKVINPFNNKSVPLYVADYVLGHYGTGAVMAVPAQYERDFEFAKKYNLPIERVVEPKFVAGPESLSAVKPGEEFIKRNAVAAIVRNPKEDTYLCISWKNGIFMHGSVTGGIDDGEDVAEAARREVLEETGYKDLELIRVSDVAIHSLFYHRIKKQNRWARFQYVLFDLKSEERDSIGEEEAALHEVVWKKREELEDFFSVIEGKFITNLINNSDYVFTDYGILHNSGDFENLDSEVAKEKMTEWLEKKGIGQKKVNYRLRDWLVSRQRYWGAPIPIIYCEKCGEVPVPEKDLPVELPDDVDFNPTGESPLVKSEKFHSVNCPECGGKARRESDTMDTFVCSSWYYLRYADPKNAEEFASKEMLKKWLPVDLYVGGAEHSVLHLLYARFFTKVLHNLGYIEFDEPFLKLRHQGMILAEDGRKMSKSLGNVINPDDVVKEFGADSLRCFEMFMGPLEDAKPWNTKGIIGVYRFLEKVYKLKDKIGDIKVNKKLENLLHKTIKKVSEDIENLRFNTAVSAVMILVNEMGKAEKISKDYLEKLLIILAPFTPHLAEELWEKLGHKESIFKEAWPEYDPSLIKDEEFELIVQISGKVRDKIKAKMDIAEEEAKELAMQSKKVEDNIGDKKIKKIIFVKNRLINIVV